MSPKNGKVFTVVHRKPAYRHQYLQSLPAHAYQTKKSVAFSQTLPISRLRSSEKDFENHKNKMKSRFKKREHPGNLISSKIRKVKFSNLRIKSNDKNENMNGIILVVTYHPLLESFSTIIDKNLSILYMDKDVKRVLSQRSMVSFHSVHKMHSYLVIL